MTEPIARDDRSAPSAAPLPSDTVLSDNEIRRLSRRLQVFGAPSARRSVLQLALTAAALTALWLIMWLSLGWGYWLTLLLAVPAAGFLVRLFVIQHDCGHGSLFAARWANDLAGRVLGVVTLTPYDYWRRTHAAHHAGSGNLDRRGIGDIRTLTVREYMRLPRWARLAYRLYRHPLVLFGIGPIYLFILKHRLPLDIGLLRTGLWRSVFATNLGIAGVLAALALLVGPLQLLMLQLPITLLAASAGIWLFYVQHQFEDAYWRHDGGWSFQQAALRGSSWYDLPRPLRWLTAGIGLHHIHHLCSRIPNYRLQECLEAHPELRQAQRLTLRDSLGCARLALWHEETGRMIRFRDL